MMSRFNLYRAPCLPVPRFAARFTGLVLGLFCGLGCVGSAQANSPFSRFTIASLVVHDDGNHILLVAANGPIANQEGCPDNSQLTLRRQHPAFKEMYAALLLAYQTSNPVVGWVNGCSAFGTPLLTRVDLWK